MMACPEETRNVMGVPQVDASLGQILTSFDSHMAA
jgi:hypothetical protein